MGKMEHDTEHSLMKALDVDRREYAHFLKLDEEKRERILTVAYDEFLEKGYGEASTNIITQKAGISKGLLFHYFGSKEGLYKFLMKKSAQRIASEALADLPDKNGDVLLTIKSIVQIKIAVCLRYPKETNFVIAAWRSNLPESLVREREKMAGMSENYFELLIGLLDNRLLRNDVEKSTAAEIIAWVCEKYTDKVLSSDVVTAAAESWSRVTEDLDKYMEALRRGLYK